MASLEERIAARLREVLEHQERGGFGVPPDTDVGMAVGGPDEPRIVLTLEDVARIAAGVAEASSREGRQSDGPEDGVQKTPDVDHEIRARAREWARRVLAEVKERRDRVDYVAEERAVAEWLRNPSGPPPWSEPSRSRAEDHGLE
jgi:hypothetical protein